MGEIISKKEVVEEKFVEFLTDFEIEFVSLVDHGANRAPFKIIRSQTPSSKKHPNKKGERRMLDVVQSVLVPAGVELRDLQSKVGWLHDVDSNKKEQFEFYAKYPCLNIERFDQTTFRIERLDDGALALVGNLIEEDSKAIIFRSYLDKQTGIDSQGYAITLRDLLSNELYNTVGAITSTLELSEMSIKDKKKAVDVALRAFQTYIEMGLDHASEGLQLRFDKADDKLAEVTREDGDEKMSEEVIERVETSEEPVDIKALIESVLAEKVTELVERAIAEREAAIPPKEEIVRVEESPAVEVKVDISPELQAQIKTLEERLAKFEAEDAELPPQSKTERVVVKKSDEPQSLWGGVLFSRIARN
jgi:hypothetical protein